MNFTTLLLLAAGGYLLYKQYGSTATAIVSQGGGTPDGESTVPTTPSLATDIRSLIMAQAIKGGEPGPNAYDVWNYYYKLVRGTYGPDWETATEKLAVGDPRHDRGFKLNINEFLALTTPLGLGRSGFGALNVANAWESADKRYIS